MIDDVIIKMLKDILINKYKMSLENVDKLIHEYAIDNTMTAEDWAEMIYRAITVENPSRTPVTLAMRGSILRNNINIICKI